MTNCGRKMKSRRGVTSVFALAIFLITALFSITMVNGALTASRNAGLQRLEEQSYLAVTSAARVFCQRAPFEATLSVKVTSDEWDAQKLQGTESEWEIVSANSDDAVIQAFCDMMSATDKNENEKAKQSLTVKVNPPPTRSGGALGYLDKEITVDLAMDADYSVTADFYPTNNDGTADNYRVSVTFGYEEQSSEWDGETLVRKAQWNVSGTERGRYQ